MLCTAAFLVGEGFLSPVPQHVGLALYVASANFLN